MTVVWTWASRVTAGFGLVSPQGTFCSELKMALAKPQDASELAVTLTPDVPIAHVPPTWLGFAAWYGPAGPAGAAGAGAGAGAGSGVGAGAAVVGCCVTVEIAEGVGAGCVSSGPALQEVSSEAAQKTRIVPGSIFMVRVCPYKSRRG
ncbi:hypothetical protein CDOO_06450 [Corynebacterium doosanense CAU 212 = DSM 45436]|uniref:Uncharacterized protein n=1 Tax=Corynebacterium doosanense CAU 212 = DSM 45436 TaxID=558173 RepID=A0A097IJI7_9CORY|nr:hypothetical protein CDOO_06450 [Corynebacterium doosanense CAU 212 = DSM 45436]